MSTHDTLLFELPYVAAALCFSTAGCGQLRATSVLSLINVAVQLCTVMWALHTAYCASVQAEGVFWILQTVCELLVATT